MAQGSTSVAGNENFQQGAFVKGIDSAPGAPDGHIYSDGTRGRSGSVYLTRFEPQGIQKFMRTDLDVLDLP